MQSFDVPVSETTIHGRTGGEGPPLLLLHGIPQDNHMWDRLIPDLLEHFTVVAADLRGYGGSGTPPSDATHTPYAMRALARDQVELMSALGHDRFAVAGHDRGGRCAYRMALDHPDVVTSLCVMDIVPTGHAFHHADMEFAIGYWVWSFLAAPAPVPERLISGDPAAFVDYMLDAWSSNPDAIPESVREGYRRQFTDPARVHAICEQYRAAATLDVTHDDEDLGRRRITCPTLVLWSEDGPLATWYDTLAVWRDWAEDVQGGPIAGGHFLPEESPDAVVSSLLGFLGRA